jgi:hypothetical protein
MEYKLLKDLPNYKAGHIVEFYKGDYDDSRVKAGQKIPDVGFYWRMSNNKDIELTKKYFCHYPVDTLPEWFEEIHHWPTSINDLEWQTGYVLIENVPFSEMKHNGNLEHLSTSKGQHTVYATEKHARSAKAFAALSLLAREMNGDWTPDWNTDTCDQKFTVWRSHYDIYVLEQYDFFHPISFKTKEMAEFSLKHHKQLWEEYYMLLK